MKAGNAGILIVMTILLQFSFMPTAVYAFEPVILESAPGNVTFSHKSHGSVACLQCHHEAKSVDHIMPCRQCHKKHAAGALNARHAFHKNCIDCHAGLKGNNRLTGPVKLCSRCHQRK